MKKTVCLTLFVCTFSWCTSVWCEENKLDPGVVNDWMRATVSEESDGTELKRVIYSSTLKDWISSGTFYVVRYEVENSSCKRTLALNFTDFHGQSYHSDWVKPIEEDRIRGSFEAESPKVLVRTYKNNHPSDAIMDLDVEYQVQDGMPLLVVANPLDVTRTLREFKDGDFARIRINAFEVKVDFTLNLKGFAQKESWFNERCPLDPTDSNNKNEVPAS